jgi:5-methylcytosine-specific restriction enzyme A
MPIRPKKPCAFNFCGALVPAGTRFCEKHRKAENKRYDKQRGNFRERGYTTQWDKARKKFLMENPLCSCGQAAVLVHHKIKVKDRPDLLLDFSNLQAMCRDCHSRVHKDDVFGGG